MELEGELAFSCLKPAEDGTPGTVVLRMVNLSDHAASGTVRCARNFSRACLCRIDESCEEEVAAEAGELSLSCMPWEIKTVKFTFPVK